MPGRIKRNVMVIMMAATGAAFAGAALAEQDCEKGDRDHAGWHGMTPEKMQERTESHLQRLESRLELNAGQQSAWEEYREHVLEGAERMAEKLDARRSGDRGHRKATVIERMERMENMAEKRLEALRETRAATAAFYDELDESQQETFDAQYHGKREKERDAQRAKRDKG